MNNIINIIYKECLFIRYNRQFRDAKLEYYANLRKKTTNKSILFMCDYILHYIFMEKYDEIMANMPN